jgi:C1A family cysteine protease
MPTERKIAGYGWIPQLPDLRDAKLQIEPVTSLPNSIDLSSTTNMPPIYDQGQLGSCTGNAIAGAVDFENHRQEGTFLTPSRLWIYYQERVIENTVSHDSGAQIRDGIKAVARLGVCPETDWPYDISTFASAPAKKDYADSLKDRAVTYQAVPHDLFALKSVLAKGTVIVFGFTVYETFESQQVASSGIVPMPSPNENVVGGHAVVLAGYDDTVDRFRVRNSWGTSWGQGGYFEMPYLYVTSPSLASDFWVIPQTSIRTSSA